MRDGNGGGVASWRGKSGVKDWGESVGLLGGSGGMRGAVDVVEVFLVEVEVDFERGFFAWLVEVDISCCSGTSSVVPVALVVAVLDFFALEDPFSGEGLSSCFRLPRALETLGAGLAEVAKTPLRMSSWLVPC